MHVLVVGAGIGGLSAALSLHAAGIGATVIDSAGRLLPLGVGINLLPHAVRELTELGLGDELAALGIPIAEFVHFDRFGGRIWGEPRGRRLGYRWPQYAVHRGELQMALLAAVRARLGDGAVRPGLAFEDYEETPGGIAATVRDRSTGAGMRLAADVLVGADGVLSTVRERLHPGEGPPLGNGIRMWRGVAEAKPFLTGRSVAVLGSNARAKFVAYPISRAAEERGAALVNWVAEVRLPERDGPSGPVDWSRRGRAGDVLPHYAGWSYGWLDVPGLIAAAPEVLEYPMVDRDPLPWWSRGRVTLLGDAAHPMYPIGSNGGTQAVLDARVLAHELANVPARAPAGAADPAKGLVEGLVEGLAAYEAARRPATRAIQLACRDMPADRVLHMVAERAPGGFDRIEDVLGPEELATITDAYKRTSSTDVAELNARPSLTV